MTLSSPAKQTAGDAFRQRCEAAVCRSCGHHGLLGILDFGPMPHSDGLLTRAQVERQEEARYPLEVAFCPTCALVQILETVAPEVLFGADYPYFSSFSETLLRHSAENVAALIASRRLGPQSLVVELASNDGYLLKNYVARGIPVLGIDPAPGPARAAESIGVPTLCTFFTRDLANQLCAEGKRADVIHANNVLAHVADTNGFVAGMRRLLKDDGVAVIEAPYVRELVEQGEFDTIYHEHLCYFSVTALNHLFARNGLHLNHVQALSIHGGSLRLFVERREHQRPTVLEYLAREQELGMDGSAYYRSFGQRVERILSELRALLLSLHAEGKTIAAYGAAAKGAILLNCLGVGPEVIAYVVDRNVHKQGRYMPGVHLEIRDPQVLMQDRPDYVLLLPWNFRDEILAQQQPYRQQGGKFILPLPKLTVL